MSRNDNTQKWEEHKKLSVFLYRRYGLRETMRLMKGSCNLDAKKREYVYRLSTWGVRKNAVSKNAPPRTRSQFSDHEELYLCLFAPLAFDTYWKQVELMGDGEQDLGLLLCCARAIETRAQSQVLAEHVERRLAKTQGGDSQETRSFLHILRGCVLHHAGWFMLDVRRAVEESVVFLQDNCCTDQAGDRLRAQYAIDIPKLTLFRHGLRLGAMDQDLWNKLLGFHVARLSAPGNEATCESTVQTCLTWCLKELGLPAARVFPPEILAVACHNVDGGPAKKAIAHVFCFLLSQYLAKPDLVDALSRSINQGLRISVCDLLYTLSALILVGPSSERRLDFDHLCTSPTELVPAAIRRADALPRGQSLLVFFLEVYAELSLPIARSFEEKTFMHEVCGRAEGLIQSLEEKVDAQEEVGDLEFVNQDMIGDETGFTDEGVF